MSSKDPSKAGAGGEARFITYLSIPDPEGNRRISLDEGSTWRIGRTPENDVVLPSDHVSRQHAIIQLTDSGEYYLLDLGSSNGTFVAGARVSVPRTLKDGDEIRVGETQMTFRCAGVEAAEIRRSKTQKFGPTRALYVPRMSTVLVADVRDFTKLTQRVDQNVLCQTIGTWFRRGGRIMQDRGSWAVKYIGDAIMAVWLHQKTSQEPQEIANIIGAYVDLAAASADLAKEFSLPSVFRIGAGINTGMASVGNAGGGGIEDFTALGDAVNAAFRIESATKETGVDLAIGGSTCASLQKSFHPEQYFRQYKVSLKGYDAPADVWGASLESAQRFLAGTKSTASSSG
jgi:adenylate cyclase